MAATKMTVTVDTRELDREVIPALLAYGRRTVEEQCVTSATFIAFNWQKGIPAADIAEIDANLDEVVRVAKAGDVTRGMEIAMQRTNPNSPYSVATGNRWPLAKPGGKRGSAEKFLYYQMAAERMKARRHSSTHFLQAGVTPIIREGMASPLYKYNAAFGSRREANAIRNPQNTVSPDELGGMEIDLKGDDCVVTGSNEIGERVGQGNAVLDAEHRRANIEYSTPALEAAVEKEKAAGYAELQRRVDLGWRIKYPQWA